MQLHFDIFFNGQYEKVKSQATWNVKNLKSKQIKETLVVLMQINQKNLEMRNVKVTNSVMKGCTLMTMIYMFHKNNY